MRFDRRVSVAAGMALIGPFALGAGLGAVLGLAAPAAMWALIAVGWLGGAVLALLRLRRLVPGCQRLVDRVCGLRPRVRVLRALMQASGPLDAVGLMEAARVRPVVGVLDPQAVRSATPGYGVSPAARDRGPRGQRIPADRAGPSSSAALDGARLPPSAVGLARLAERPHPPPRRVVQATARRRAAAILPGGAGASRLVRPHRSVHAGIEQRSRFSESRA